MLYENLKALLKQNRNWSVVDWIAGLSLIFAVGVLSYHFYQINRDLPYVETLRITDPVVIDNNQYRIGSTITGYFEGERFSNKPVIFNRTLTCDHFRAVLKPIRIESPSVGPINRDSPVLTLTDNTFLVGQLLAPQSNCELIFSPQTVVEKYILGGEKLQQDQSFRTTAFDVVE